MRALSYLHRRNVVHADVKLENLLFSSDQIDSLHLVDFGLSINIRNVDDIPQGARGTLNYMAPELLQCDLSRPIMPQLCDRTDVWAAGVVLFTLSCGFLPFNGSSQEHIIKQMTAPEETIHSWLSSIPQFQCLHIDLQHLILSMLRVNPAERITSSETLRHRWFVNGRNESLREERKFVEILDLKAMAVYGKTPVLKKITLMFLAVRLSPTTLPEIKKKFDEADRDDDGLINPLEFNAAFS